MVLTNKKDHHTSRRSFLGKLIRSSALGSAAMPLSLGGLSQLAQAQGGEKLKVVFAVIPDGFGVDPHGGYDGLWFPQASSSDSTTISMNEMSQHLGRHANQSLFLRQLIIGSGTGGHNGWQTVLRDSASQNTSIDLLLGNALPGTNNTIKRIYSGPHAMVGAAWNVSYQNNSMLRPEENPYQLFEQVVGNVDNSLSGSTVPQSKTHLLDPATARIKALRLELSGRERAKLDMHLDAIEQVSQDLQNNLPLAAECSPLNASPTPSMDINSADFREPVTRAHADVIATGLSCGVSRVATFQIGRSADPVVIKDVSTTRNPHDCAHRYGSVAEWRDSRAWYIHQVKYLLDQLDSMPDPDSAGDSLLDHTLVVLTSEMADGAPEHMQDVPVTLIGGASGLLQNGNGGGRYYDLKTHGERSHWKMGTAVDMQRVWATIASAAGTTVPYAGNISNLPGIFTNV